MGRLDGTVALVTGGASGIGEGIARTFTAQGCSVVIGDIEADRGTRVAADIGARYAELDVTEADQWRTVVDATVAELGRLDILVNNAGASSGVHRMDHEAPEDFERILRLNVTGAWNGIRAVMSPMKAQGGGSIVNIASIDSYVGVAGMTTYVTTKFGLLGMTKSAALELGDLGIRVNSVHPGIIDTPGLATVPEAARAELLRAVVSQQPLKRLGSPDDVARAALFFASDDSAYCTGASIVVDGGHIAGRYRALPE